MAAVEVEDVGEAILEDPSNGVIVGQVMVLREVPVLVEADGCAVGGEHVKVDGFAVVLCCSRDVLLQTLE